MGRTFFLVQGSGVLRRIDENAYWLHFSKAKVLSTGSSSGSGMEAPAENFWSGAGEADELTGCGGVVVAAVAAVAVGRGGRRFSDKAVRFIPSADLRDRRVSTGAVLGEVVVSVVCNDKCVVGTLQETVEVAVAVPRQGGRAQ